MQALMPIAATLPRAALELDRASTAQAIISGMVALIASLLLAAPAPCIKHDRHCVYPAPSPCTGADEELHHIATTKRFKKPQGPLTWDYEKFFAAAQVPMTSKLNTICLQGHEGQHPEVYHQLVYQHLLQSVGNTQQPARAAQKLKKALRELAGTMNDGRSALHCLATHSGDESVAALCLDPKGKR